jgi:S-adenosylmethionine:tRNA ribosyltransferase-isomerase
LRSCLSFSKLSLVRAADFDYPLPSELIAQRPTAHRDQSRLLIVQRNEQNFRHANFPELLDYLRAGDVLVLNNSKVVPARLRAVNAASGGEFELLLLTREGVNDWWAMMRPGKRARLGTQLRLRDRTGVDANIIATVIGNNEEGHRRLRFEGTADLSEELPRIGEIPLPPYVKRADSTELADDWERYQTVYAQLAGSIAAPTAGLHFTPPLLEKIGALGAKICFVTLHVGLGTFAPVKVENLAEHLMHEEVYEVPLETSRIINDAKRAGQRIVAVGTTTVRVLESALNSDGRIIAGPGRTRRFIYPPYQFRCADALLTNFHLPRSTLLMLVSAFAAPGKTSGRELALRAYEEAVRERYRFFSYGDAMLLL